MANDIEPDYKVAKSSSFSAVCLWIVAALMRVILQINPDLILSFESQFVEITILALNIAAFAYMASAFLALRLPTALGVIASFIGLGIEAAQLTFVLLDCIGLHFIGAVIDPIRSMVPYPEVGMFILMATAVLIQGSPMRCRPIMMIFSAIGLFGLSLIYGVGQLSINFVKETVEGFGGEPDGAILIWFGLTFVMASLVFLGFGLSDDAGVVEPGRRRRTRYWERMVGFLIALIVTVFVFIAFSELGGEHFWGEGIARHALILLVSILFFSQVPVKISRCHDVGMSGWCFAPIFIAELVAGIACMIDAFEEWLVFLVPPGIGAFVVEIVLLGGRDGQKGENRYGPDPKRKAEVKIHPPARVMKLVKTEPTPATTNAPVRVKVPARRMESAPAPAPLRAVAPVERAVTAEERDARAGESFRCPYCRTIVPIDNVYSVSTSASLMGDDVLGENEQQRFLPTKFTGNGLALDEGGGVCTEIACPHCHMTLPSKLMHRPQIVMSVIGAAGAGKSVFLASAMWQCRKVLPRQFGMGFLDLDPAANRWINAYEEKLFFQEDIESLQQIEKTDLQASNVTRMVSINGDRTLLPLPSFFSLRSSDGRQQPTLLVYDSAGEHFRAGADIQSGAVTLNMLNADLLFFMYDPSADPRFRDYLVMGEGTARNYAQRQDTLLNEMSNRIQRHLGNRGQTRLTRPLIFGVSKADLLRNVLPLDAPIVREIAPNRWALDVEQLQNVSLQTESLLSQVVPEVVMMAREIAEEVWFLPVSALGHNPMKEGVRPCDIRPIWAELPVLITLAKKGLVETVNGVL